MAGVAEDGQVAELLHSRNDAEVERVTRVVHVGADAALAEHNVAVTFAHDVLGAHQKLFQGGAESALEQHGERRTAGALKQRVVLHVARADLNHVGVVFDGFQGLGVHGLGDDEHAEALAHFGQNLQALYAHALEGVGRGARLVGAAAEHAGSGLRDFFSDGQRLLAALHRAGPGDDRELRAADGNVGVGEAHDGVVGFTLPADQLEGLADAYDLLHARHVFQAAALHIVQIAGHGDGVALGALHGVGAEAEGFDPFADLLNLLPGCLRLHDNQHGDLVKPF